MQKPLISIIVPVFGTQNFLSKCLNGLKNQTYTNVEIILIDDGSPDRSGEICDKFAEADSRFKVIHQKNGGLCCARNTGLKQATGEYIGFVDSDDWVKEDMYEYLLNNALEYDADIVSCAYYRVVPNEETVSVTDGALYVYNGEQALRELLTKFVLRNVFWNKLYKKSLFDDVLFPEGRTFEGTQLMYKIFEKAQTVVQLPEPKYYYVDNPKSIVNVKSLVNSMDFIHSNILRYNDLGQRYPEYKMLLFKQTVTAIRKLSYIGYKMSERDVALVSRDIKEMQDFLCANNSLLTVADYSKAVLAEIKLLSLGTLSGFKKAHALRAGTNRLSKVKTAVFGENKPVCIPQKPQDVVPLSDMTPVQQDKLQRLHQAEIEILDEIDRICKKNNIQYYLYGGTLLGAVRHGGFIPWDDDMDLVMLRRDYDRFAKACNTELDGKYFYQTCFTDGEYPLLFAKVRKNGTFFGEEKTADKNIHNGVFVDILPLDYFPKSKALSWFFLHYISVLHQSCALDKPNYSNPLNVLYYKTHSFLPKKTRYTIRDKALRLSNAIGSKDLVCSYGSHYQPMARRVLKAAWFEGDYRGLSFGDKQYPVPSHYEGYLLHLYGEDYMSLPTPENRVCHADIDRIILCEDDAEQWKKDELNRLCNISEQRKKDNGKV